MFDDLNEIYTCCSNGSLTIHEVFDPDVYEFSKGIIRFQKLLYATEQEEAWRTFTGKLKRYRFLISTSPLPLNSDRLGNEINHKRLGDFLHLKTEGLKGSDEVIDQANRLLLSFQGLIESEKNKLEVKFLELLPKKDWLTNTAVVLLDNDLVITVKDYLKSKGFLKSLEVLPAFRLKGFKAYKRIFMFGSPGWFLRKGHSYLFSAPRSTKIELISYSWINNKVIMATSFDCPQPVSSKNRKAGKIDITIKPEQGVPELDKDDFEIFLPVLDISTLKKRIEQEEIGDSYQEDDDIAEAFVAILEQKKAVFLEHSEDATSLILNLEIRKNETDDSHHIFEEFNEDDNEPKDTQETKSDNNVKLLIRCLNTDIEEGMFLLLRTAGGGDYIVQVADKILGRAKHNCRSNQKKWKFLFKTFLESQGPEQVQKKIKEFGGTSVHKGTLRNWTRDRNIGPGSGKNFKAILKLIGLESELDEYLKNTETIRRAHRKAGVKIRKLLLQRIQNSNLDQLHNNGTMIFDLPGIDTSASMTAFRIARILSEIHEVPYQKLGCAVDIEDDLWL